MLAYPFTPSENYDLGKVELELMKVNSPTGNIWVEIWSDNGSDDPNVQIGADSAVVAAATLSTSDGFIAFTFSSPISLTSGTKYWIVLNDNRVKDDTNIVKWCGNIAGLATKGHYHVDQPAWTNWNDINFNYKNYAV
jgi:hypothetical protein